MTSSPFSSFFMAGFECSTQKRRDGRRLDLIVSTHHDINVEADYRACVEQGLTTVRDGLRWHLIERAPGVYDWSTWRPMLRAAKAAGVQVIWDLCHYGWPNFVDLWSDRFVERYTFFAEAAARVFAEEMDGAVPLWCPMNEISFFAWAAGEVGHFFPTANGRGPELKQQLVRAAVSGAKACRRVDERARFVWCEPLIRVARTEAKYNEAADGHHNSQFEAFDMIAGLTAPELGGQPELLDIVGLNYYPHNQWYYGGPNIPMGHHEYVDLRDLLAVVHARYDRPMMISETGAERNARAPWFHYICEEVRAAMATGAPMQGVCVYPILAYPGWDNDRHCDVGLFRTPEGGGERTVHEPLAREMRRQQAEFAEMATS